MEATAALLKIAPQKIHERISHLLEESKNLSNELKQYRKAALKQTGKHLAEHAVKAGSIPCVCSTVDVDSELLPDLAEETMQVLRSGVLVLAIKADQRCQLLVKVSADLTQRGIQAVQLIKEIAPLVGGSGGGKADSAQAGGKSPEGLTQAFEKAKQWLSKH